MPASHENFSLDLHKVNEAETIALLTDRMEAMGWDKKRQLMDDMLTVYLKHLSGIDASAEPLQPSEPAAMDYELLGKAIANGIKDSGGINVTVQINGAISANGNTNENGNGHHTDTDSEPAEELLDPNDPLVRALSDINFDSGW